MSRPIRSQLEQGPDGFQSTVNGKVFEPKARPEIRCEVATFAEGPAWHPSGALYFSDLANNRILRLGPAQHRPDVFLQPSGRANGLHCDHDGHLIVCEGNEIDRGGRRLTRIDLATRERTVLAHRFMGKRLNSPNDLCIDASGRIWFTDPYYGSDRHQLEQDAESIYRYDSGTSKLARADAHRLTFRPNGIGLSPDERTLYVTDNQPDPINQLVAFRIDQQGRLYRRTVLYDFGLGRGGDGMCVDSDGRIFVASGAHWPDDADAMCQPGVYVFGPDGGLLETIELEDDTPTNCTFGDADMRSLYVTGIRAVWRIRLNAPGRSGLPKAPAVETATRY